MAFYTLPEYQSATTEDISSYLKTRRLPSTSLNIDAARIALNREKLLEALPKGRDVSFTGSDQSRQVVYGYARVPGTIVFAFIEEDNSELHTVAAIAGHEIQSIQEVYLDDARIDFPSVPGVSSAIVPKTGSAIYTDKIYLEKRLGADSQAAMTYIVGQVPLAWTSTHALLGIAAAGLSFKWDASIFAGGFPSYSFLVYGKKVYDPRTTTTYFSNNAALVIADYLTDTRLGLGYAWDKIDIDSLSAAANVCGESVTLASGASEIRYAIDGYFLASETPSNVLSEFTKAFAGKLTYTQGTWKFWPGTARTLVFDFTIDDILSPISIDSNTKKTDLINKVTGTFLDSLNDYAETDFPIVKNSSYITADGEKLELDLRLKFTASSARAQRISKILLEYSRQGLKVSFVAKIRSLVLEVGDFVTLTLPKYGWDQKEFEVYEMEVLEDGNAPNNALVCSFILKETAATIYDWANGEETTYDLAPNSNLPSAFQAPTLSGLSLASGTSHLLRTGSGEIISRIYVSWTSAASAFVTSGGKVEVQYRVSGAGNWIDGGSVNGALSNYYITSVKDGAPYDVRIRPVNALGVAGDWLTQTDYLVVGKTEKPSDVSGFTYSVSDFVIAFSWSDISDADRSFYEIRLGASWDTASLVDRVKLNRYTIQARSTGSYVYLIKAVDTSGNYSTNAASTSFTITAPTVSSASGEFIGENLVLTWAANKGSFLIDEFVVYYGATFASATKIANVYTTSFSIKGTWLNDRIFWIVAKDIAGNASTEKSVAATISKPDAITSIMNEVVDNNVLLKWGASGSSTLPIARYNIYKGSTFQTASFQGSSDTTFKALFELTAGTFIYWIVPVDTAGNLGVETSTTANVASPPDFELILNQSLVPENADTLTNIAFEGQFLRTVDGGFFDFEDVFF